MVKDFLKKYWPIIIILILLGILIYISFKFYDTGITISLNDNNNLIWNIEKNVSIKFVSVFITLLAGTGFIFSLLFSTYNFNLLKLDIEERDNKIEKLNNTFLKQSQDIAVYKASIDKYETLLNSIKQFIKEDDKIDKLIKANDISNVEIITKKISNSQNILTTNDK